MNWTKLYIIVVICFGLYRQFIIPEQFNYNKTWIWTGAIVWPGLAVIKVISWAGIANITELDLIKSNGSLL